MAVEMLESKRASLSLAWVAAALLSGGCVATGHHADPPPPMPHEIGQMGYDEAIQVGSAYAQRMGYTDAELQDASQTGQNLWRVRFGLKRSAEKKVLSLELDGTQRRLLKAEESGGVAGAYQKPIPIPESSAATH